MVSPAGHGACSHALRWRGPAAKPLAPGIWARGYNGTDRENSQYEVVSSHSITLRRPCEVARTNDGNSVLVLATFSEPQRLCLVVPASSSLSQCDGQWRAARRALPGRFAAQWPCEGCGRLALPILLTCRSAPRGPVAESSGGAEIERARFGRRGWTCAAARVRLVHARPHVLGCCGKSRLAAWPARPFKFLSHSAAAKRAHSADWHGARGRRASPRRRSWPPARA